MRSNSFLCYFVQVTHTVHMRVKKETLNLFVYAFSSTVRTAREPVIRKFENCIVIYTPPYLFRVYFFLRLNYVNVYHPYPVENASGFFFSFLKQMSVGIFYIIKIIEHFAL